VGAEAAIDETFQYPSQLKQATSLKLNRFYLKPIQDSRPSDLRGTLQGAYSQTIKLP
jgi:hypothetical protein